MAGEASGLTRELTIWAAVGISVALLFVATGSRTPRWPGRRSPAAPGND
jgi:hypothetical protein